MKYFHLITWKEFNNRKLVDKQEVIHVENVDEGLSKIKELNAQKRLTTTDYRSINLTLLLEDNGLQISELIRTGKD